MTAAETWMGPQVAGAAGMTAWSCSLQRLLADVVLGID